MYVQQSPNVAFISLLQCCQTSRYPYRRPCRCHGRHCCRCVGCGCGCQQAHWQYYPLIIVIVVVVIAVVVVVVVGAAAVVVVVAVIAIAMLVVGAMVVVCCGCGCCCCWSCRCCPRCHDPHRQSCRRCPCSRLLRSWTTQSLPSLHWENRTLFWPATRAILHALAALPPLIPYIILAGKAEETPATCRFRSERSLIIYNQVPTISTAVISYLPWKIMSGVQSEDLMVEQLERRLNVSQGSISWPCNPLSAVLKTCMPWMPMAVSCFSSRSALISAWPCIVLAESFPKSANLETKQLMIWHFLMSRLYILNHGARW